MARPRKKTGDEIAPPQRGRGRPPSTVEALREEIAASGAEESIDRMLAAFNASADDTQWKIEVNQVYGAPRDGMKEPWLFDIDQSEVEGLKHRLRAEYPEGGRFRVRIKLNLKPFGQFDIELPPARKPFAPIAPAAPAADPMLAAIERLEKSQTEFMTRLLDRLAAPAAAPVDPMAAVAQLAGVMKTVQELAPKPDSDTSMKMFLTGIETAMKFTGGGGGGGDGGETSLLDIVKEAISSEGGQRLMGAAAMQIAALPSAAPAPAPQVAPQLGPRSAAPLPDAPPPPAAPPAGVPPALNSAMIFLLDKAKAGADPALFAEWTLDNLPPVVLDHLAEQPDIPGYLAQVFPGAGAHRDWLAALVEKMNELEEQDQGRDPPTTESGQNGVTAGAAGATANNS